MVSVPDFPGKLFLLIILQEPGALLVEQIVTQTQHPGKQFFIRYNRRFIVADSDFDLRLDILQQGIDILPGMDKHGFHETVVHKQCRVYMPIYDSPVIGDN